MEPIEIADVAPGTAARLADQLTRQLHGIAAWPAYEMYLYVRRQTPDAPPAVIVADDAPGPDWELADPRPLRPSMQYDAVRRQLLDALRYAPIMPV